MDVRKATLCEAIELHSNTVTMPMTLDEAIEWHYNAYREMHRICKENGVRLIVFSAPVTKFYRDAVPAKLKAQMNETVAWLKQEGIPYIDCMASMSEDTFRDATHLLPSAARRFTPLLLRQIKQLAEP